MGGGFSIPSSSVQSGLAGEFYKDFSDAALGDALVEAIGCYLESSDLRERVGRTAEEDVRSRADHDTNMTRVEEIYYSLVEGRDPTP